MELRPKETPPVLGSGSAVPSPLQSICRAGSRPGTVMDLAELGALKHKH